MTFFPSLLKKFDLQVIFSLEKLYGKSLNQTFAVKWRALKGDSMFESELI